MLESFEARSATPYEYGSYEWIAGTAVFAIKVAAKANARIVDLDAVEPDAAGTVRFEADVRMLKPVDGASSRRSLLVVPNRGMPGGVPLSMDVPAGWPSTDAPHPGDGFLLDRGWTIAWCGWQWDVVRANGHLGLNAPTATVEPGWMRVEFRPDIDLALHALGDSSQQFRFTDYPTADVRDNDAVLTVRTAPLGPKRPIPRHQWRFVDPTHVEVDGGFRAFHWYELIYRSAVAPVVGTGLLAVRDFAAFLRDSHDWVFALGKSQSGRFLREFLYCGLNVDEQGQQVFDGMMCHIAGARRGEFNRRYGQPALAHPLTPGFGPPYDSAGLLSVQRSIGGVPKVFFTNSAWEYWRGDGCLVHQDALTGMDLPEDPDARAYLFSGTDHFSASHDKESLPTANPTHQLDGEPLLRGLLVQLEQWVCDGVDPSPSRVPRHADGTAATRPEVLKGFHGGAIPDPSHLPYTPAIDPDATSWPLQLGNPAAALVSGVDATGNELAGVRLPAVAAPIAAYTGWNPRAHIAGLPDVLYEFTGSRLPLQSGCVEATPSAYETRVRKAAYSLVADRFLVGCDVDRTVNEAMRLFHDAAAGSQ